MRTPYAAAFLLILLLAGTYMYTAVEAVCNVPLSYRIGEFDERFDITRDEARVAIADAESVWEQATGRNLFTYDEDDGEILVNFIYDDRQAFAEAEVDLRDRLDAAEDVNSAISESYAELVDEYEVLEAEYRDRVESYERKLAQYNAEVEQYNESGGAPPEVYEELQEQKEQLDQDQRSINALSDELNGLAEQINQLGEQGNQLVEKYNHHVDTYNETFGESREFTQGDYRGKDINIYKFVNDRELELVLAHELGHSLSLGHVENEESILYHLMGGQPDELRLSEEDLDEFERICGNTTRSFIERLFILFNI